jgi:hypothetical protein
MTHFDLDNWPRCPNCDHILAHYTASPSNPSFFYCANLGCDNNNGYDDEMNIVVKVYPDLESGLCVRTEEVQDEVHIQEGNG